MTKILAFFCTLIIISKLFCVEPQEVNEKEYYLLLSVHTPNKTPLHKILSDIPADQLLLMTTTKFFSEEDKDKLHPFFNSITRIEDYRDSGKLELEVRELYQQKPFKKIIIYHEYDILRAARLRDFFGLEGQNYASALVFRDKVLMKKTLLTAGIKVPSFMKVSSPIDVWDFVKKNGFPVIIKPVFGTGAERASLLNNEQDVNHFVQKEKSFNDFYQTDLEIESFIKGTMYHVDGFVYNGELVAAWPSICLNSCLDLTRGEFVAHHHLSPENPMVERLNEYVKQVINALPTPKNTGFILEVLHDEENDELIFCEIASRIGGGVKEMWPEAFNIDIENEFIRVQAGLKPSKRLLDFFDWNQNISSLNSISGWIIFPKLLGTLKSIEKVTPFSWVKEYHVKMEPGTKTLATGKISDGGASAFIVANSEEDFKQKVLILNDWFKQNTKWDLDPMDAE